MYFCRVEIENFCFYFVHSGSVCCFIRAMYCVIHSGAVFYLIRGGSLCKRRIYKLGGGKSMHEYLGEVYAIFPISKVTLYRISKKLGFISLIFVKILSITKNHSLECAKFLKVNSARGGRGSQCKNKWGGSPRKFPIFPIS